MLLAIRLRCLRPWRDDFRNCLRLAGKDGKVNIYKIEIENIYANAKEKNMVIKITDKRLLNKTGGIVQGMSGSPIIQNGKVIGAVTHVMINDPTRGYGILAENMLKSI